ncbi:MAG: transposase [Deltaproteobacteria bacterium]|nr:transposase [Deltaproteobacteria bacterium]
MSRPLRIEYPGAWYHVMNRGRKAENIFAGKEDYQKFFELLKESSEMWNVTVAAYCLMPSHYHMLIQTPDANLSRFMRHVNGVYTQRFNRLHGCDGHLFRGRYKSILVDEDAYLLQLVRYIHRNPLEAELVDKLDEYEWSSHKGYISRAKKWDWISKDFMLSMLTMNKRQQRRAYRQFVAKENTEAIVRVFEGKRLPSLLGSDRFIDWVKDRFFKEKDHEEVPDSRGLAPDREKIKETVSRFYQVNQDDLLKSKRGVFNEPRNVAIYLSRLLRGDRLNELGRDFDLKRYSSVSTVLQRTKAEILKDRELRQRVEKLKAILIKSQP